VGADRQERLQPKYDLRAIFLFAAVVVVICLLAVLVTLGY
jgi:hypothetical protein